MNVRILPINCRGRVCQPENIHVDAYGRANPAPTLANGGHSLKIKLCVFATLANGGHSLKIKLCVFVPLCSILFFANPFYYTHFYHEKVF